jgi:hypothetical protein
MPGFDLRGQNRLLRRTLALLPVVVLGLVHLVWDEWVQGREVHSAVGGAVFFVIVGSVVGAIFVGHGVPRLWMRISDRDRHIMLRGALFANLLGWGGLAWAAYSAW